MSSALSIENLSVRLNGSRILGDINFQAQVGKIYGFLGPNGAGKTTLLKTILGAVPYTGSVRIPATTTLVGNLIEAPAFYSRLSGFENLKLFADYRGIRDNLEKILSEVGLAHVAQKKFAQMSMGMRQRLGIARALLGNPNLLVLDEPTNGLDPTGIRDIRELLLNKQHTEGVTTIVSSHNLPELAAIADVLLMMKDGTLLCEVTTTGSTGYEIERHTSGSVTVTHSDTGQITNLEDLYFELLGGKE